MSAAAMVAASGGLAVLVCSAVCLLQWRAACRRYREIPIRERAERQAQRRGARIH